MANVKTRPTRAEILELGIMSKIEDQGLRFAWIRFIDEYLLDLNPTRAYKAVYDKPEKKLSGKVAGTLGSKLLKKVGVRAEIRARLKAQTITKPSIQAGLLKITQLFDENPNPYTGAVANKAYETLAKIGGFVQPEATVNNFFNGNVAVFQPVVDKKDNEEMLKIIEGTGRLIE